MILTSNERRVLRFLATSIDVAHSMNGIAKQCRLTPNGAHKMLTKLERCGVLKARPIANLKAYALDFKNETTSLVLGLAFIPDRLDGRIRARADDLMPLKDVTEVCVLFGSYITTKKAPGDMDLLVVLKQKDYATYKRALTGVQDVVPVKMHDVVQTMADVEQNLRKNDPVVAAALRDGVVLWGAGALVKGIRHAHR